MVEFLFYLFSSITLLSALMCVTNRQAVNGAMFMIVAFVGMAALFILLEAYFLAAVQVLVYAGAVVVLFLFIIMLLDLDKNKIKFTINIPTYVASLTAFALLTVAVLKIFGTDSTTNQMVTVESKASALINFGRLLFTKYMLVFQVSGFLLLIAMIGVIILSKKTNTLPEEQTND